MTAFHHLVKRLREAERELEKQLEGIRADFVAGVRQRRGEAALGEAESRGLVLSLPRVRALGCGPTARTGDHGDVLVEALHVELRHDRP